MKTFRTFIFLKPFSYFLSFLILWVSCTPNEEIIISGKLKEKSGEELFRNILFKEGDLGKQLYGAKDLEVIEKLDSKLVNELGFIKNQIILKIRTIEPMFFEEFKSKILSNNHTIVLEAITEARTMVKEIIHKEQNDMAEQGIKINNVRDIKEEYLYDKEACVGVLIIVLVAVIFVVLFAEIENSEISILENEMLVEKIILNNKY